MALKNGQSHGGGGGGVNDGYILQNDQAFSFLFLFFLLCTPPTTTTNTTSFSWSVHLFPSSCFILFPPSVPSPCWSFLFYQGWLWSHSYHSRMIYIFVSYLRSIYVVTSELWSSVLFTLQKCICSHFTQVHSEIYTTHSSRPTLCHNNQEFSVLLCLVFCCCFYFPKIFPFCVCKWLFLMLEVCSVDYVGYFPLHVPSLCFACFCCCFSFFSLCVHWFTLNRVCFII